jgi:hypothetical protein
MRLVAAIIGLVTLAGILAVSRAASPGDQRGTGTLEGKAVDARTRKPVAGAAVVILRTTSKRPTPLMAPESDKLGRFHMTGLGPGVYTFQVSAKGHGVAKKTVKIAANKAKLVVFSLK